MIDLADIGPDDYVIIQDVAGNVASGTVHLTTVDDAVGLFIRAFGVAIIFAQQSRAGNWKPARQVKVTGHTPVLIGADIDDG